MPNIRKKYHGSYYQANKEKIKARSNEYYAKNKEKIHKKMKERYKNNKNFYIDQHLKYRYNVSTTEYNDMFDAQKGKCIICGTHQSNLKRSLSIDHSHKTNKVRGLLCTKCNLILGLADDNVNLLQNAIKYLENND